MSESADVGVDDDVDGDLNVAVGEEPTGHVAVAVAAHDNDNDNDSVEVHVEGPISLSVGGRARSARLRYESVGKSGGPLDLVALALAER